MSKSIEQLIKENSEINEGDIVVHKDCGIGRFVKLEEIAIADIRNDYLKIEYANSTFLFVPIEDFDLITRYGEENPNIKLDSIGSASWSKRKTKLKEKLKSIASELIEIASRRKKSQAPILNANEGEYSEFCSLFEFTPTKDQINAVKDIENDLMLGRPMDRLTCGDVGFGKTEVAMRACFIAAKSEKNSVQVAIVVPTTLLCHQHYINFSERFANTNLKISSISRNNSIKENKKIKEELKTGEINIIIGTHSLLSEKLEFHNLGLVIIDEEQRFGVKQKEVFKKLKKQTHILTLSATPIPRTLQMAMTGIRDLSIISTPPFARLPIKTHIMEYDEEKINLAINREIERNGRVFFVVPRIQDIPEVEIRLKNIHIPYAVAHGQKSDLEQIMEDFYDGKYKLIIATTIIESGIDIPMANTIIIYKANNFGLAQLYQLRGRVGRGKEQAYAYITTKNSESITEASQKRLEVMDSIEGISAGFVIASNDMDIRGSGNMIGEEQSGHIKEVGVELYNSMLIDTVKNLNSNIEEKSVDFTPKISLSVSTIIPSDYISDISIKMNFYRRIADIKNYEDLNRVKNELENEFGAIPPEVQNLLQIEILKEKCRKNEVIKMDKTGYFVIVEFYNHKFRNPDSLFSLIQKDKNIFIENGVKVKFIIQNNIFDSCEDFLNKIDSL